MKIYFEWDEGKNKSNVKKHKVNFTTAQYVFLDKRRIVAKDLKHSYQKQRFYCFGKVKGGVLTVRFTYRKNRVRIIGAGFWKKGERIYEKENLVHK